MDIFILFLIAMVVLICSKGFSSIRDEAAALEDLMYTTKNTVKDIKTELELIRGRVETLEEIIADELC